MSELLEPDAVDSDLTHVLESFSTDGFARLGKILTESGAMALGARANALMTGENAVDGLFYQHDSPTGRYEDLDFSSGWVGPSLRYRKLERLERDPLFAAWIANPLFRRLAEQLVGRGATLYRSVLWNKAPSVGMAVPWHQDDGRFWGLDRAPMLQIWTALDDADEQSGCLEVVAGSHHAGLASREGGTIPAEMTDAATVTRLPARRGESILVHNHLWHRTGRNHSGSPRRAVSLSILEGATRCARRRRAPRRFIPLDEIAR